MSVKHTQRTSLFDTAGAPGGGFILSDAHGEIPFQVSDDILLTISETVHSMGVYPITKMGKS